MLVHGTNGGKSDACPRRPSPPDTSLARHWEVALPRAAYHLAAVSEKEMAPDRTRVRGMGRTVGRELFSACSFTLSPRTPSARIFAAGGTPTRSGLRSRRQGAGRACADPPSPVCSHAGEENDSHGRPAAEPKRTSPSPPRVPDRDDLLRFRDIAFRSASARFASAAARATARSRSSRSAVRTHREEGTPGSLTHKIAYAPKKRAQHVLEVAVASTVKCLQALLGDAKPVVSLRGCALTGNLLVGTN